MITYEQAISANNFEHVSAINADKTHMRCKRTGQTKTWKRNDNFMIPVKRGLYETGYIANFDGPKCKNNADKWDVS